MTDRFRTRLGSDAAAIERPERRHAPVHRVPPRSGPAKVPDGGAAALVRLEQLLAAAAATPLDDPAWQRLRDAARWSTAALIQSGLLPRQLQVTATDPPVAVARMLAVAWRHTRHPADRPSTTRASIDGPSSRTRRAVNDGGPLRRSP